MEWACANAQAHQFGRLALRNRLNGALIGAGAAFRAKIRVNLVMLRSHGDRADGALICTAAAGSACVTDYICHSSTPPNSDCNVIVTYFSGIATAKSRFSQAAQLYCPQIRNTRPVLGNAGKERIGSLGTGSRMSRVPPLTQSQCICSTGRACSPGMTYTAHLETESGNEEKDENTACADHAVFFSLTKVRFRTILQQQSPISYGFGICSSSVFCGCFDCIRIQNRKLFTLAIIWQE